MARGDYLGEFELVVMLALARLDNAYGKTVFEEIERVTGRADLTIPAVYVTLNRLEKKGLLESAVGETTEHRAGRAKKHYQLTDDGLRAVKTSRTMLERLFSDAAEQSA